MFNRLTKPTITAGRPRRPDGFPHLPESPYEVENMLAYLCELEACVLTSAQY